MKNFIIKIIIFFSGMALIDFTWGTLFKYLDTHPKSEKEFNNQRISTKDFQDIVILGSSRGKYHYIPQTITDSTGYNCQNFSAFSQGIFHLYGRYLLISKLSNPKLIIYDIFNEYDINTEIDRLHYINELKPYIYETPKIRLYIEDIFPLEKYKMQSYLYLYNSDNAYGILSRFRRNDTIPNKGFVAATGILKNKDVSPKTYSQADTLKLAYISRLIDETRQKGSDIVFCISPTYGEISSKSYQKFFELAKKKNITIFNHLMDKRITKNNKYFKDRVHLNKEGATLYSTIIAHEIKEYLKHKENNKP